MTEHHCVELKDQDISPTTRNRFEVLKKEYPWVFLLNNQDNGCTSLITMHVDMGDSPPFVKSGIHYLLSITAGFNKKSKHWDV